MVVSTGSASQVSFSWLLASLAGLLLTAKGHPRPGGPTFPPCRCGAAPWPAGHDGLACC